MRRDRAVKSKRINRGSFSYGLRAWKIDRMAFWDRVEDLVGCALMLAVACAGIGSALNDIFGR